MEYSGLTLDQFQKSKYFKNFKCALEDENILESDYRGFFGYLGFNLSEMESIKRKPVENGLRLWYKKCGKEATLAKVEEALKVIRRLDCIHLLHAFVNDKKHRTGDNKESKQNLWKSLFMMKRRTGLSDDNISIGSTLSLKSWPSITSESSMLSNDLDMDNNQTDLTLVNNNDIGKSASLRKQYKERNKSEKHKESTYTELEMSQDKNISLPTRSTRNTGSSEPCEALVLSYLDDHQHEHNGLTLTNYLRKVGINALLNRGLNTVQIMFHLKNAKQLIVVISQPLLDLSREPEGKDSDEVCQSPESEILRSCMTTINIEAFNSKYKGRIVLVTYDYTLRMKDLPYFLQCFTVYRLPGSKECRKNLLRRLLGIQNAELCELGKRIPLKPVSFKY